jgi:hypothetical protein
MNSLQVYPTPYGYGPGPTLDAFPSSPTEAEFFIVKSLVPGHLTRSQDLNFNSINFQSLAVLDLVVAMIR